MNGFRAFLRDARVQRGASPVSSPLPRILLLLCAFGPCHPGLAGESTGQVVGHVATADGQAADDARVSLVELHRSAFVDAEGAFRFEAVPPGAYHLEAVSRRFGSAVAEIVVGAGTTDVALEISAVAHRERIVVTASRSGRGSAEVVQPVNVIDQAALAEKLRPTLGETLADEPGVSSSYYGPGASRPVIRGQGGGRLRVLESGLDVDDASTTSPDHAVATDAVAAERIEILRGPSTLLYGSAAVGGVVNVIDQRVPEYAPQQPVAGTISLRYASGANERTASAALHGGQGHFAWYADALGRETDDYEIPGHAVAGDAASASGELPNSALESSGGTVGLSWVGDDGFIGVSLRALDTFYGVPSDDPDPVQIDMRQRRFDLRGGVGRAFGPFDSARFGIGVTDYEHRELEGDEIGTRFFADTVEGRLELTHGGGHGRRGVVGLQYGRRDLAALGEEAFLPAADTRSVALFGLEEFSHGPLRFEAGLRVESNSLESSATELDPRCAPARGREFGTVSGSVGLVWLANDAWALGGAVTRGVRPPGAEELYSCGAHVATLSFEVGNPELDEETSLGLDVSLRRRKGRVTGELTLFANRYADYITELATGETHPGTGLPVFDFIQADTEFLGAELRGTVGLVHREGHDLDLELVADLVRAEFERTGEPLPRIPPARVGLGLRYRGTAWQAGAEARRVAEQDRTAPGESATDGYTLIEASAGYRWIGPGRVHDVMLRGANLTDRQARSHSSRLKDRVPLPGRDVALVYRLVF